MEKWWISDDLKMMYDDFSVDFMNSIYDSNGSCGWLYVRTKNLTNQSWIVSMFFFIIG